MRKPTLASALLAVAVASAALLAVPQAPALAQIWTITTIDNTGDVGRYPDLQVDSAGNLHLVYYRSDSPALKVISKVSGVWSAPEVLDNSGSAARGTIAIGPGDVRKAAYRRTDMGAQWFAGPELPRNWTTQALVQDEDIGRSLTTTMLFSGEIGVAYRNETDGALHHIRRDPAGSWTAPVVVDPGPNRGRYFDLAYRSGSGYLFSEHDPINGALLLADPVLHSRPWSFEQVTSEAEADVGGGLSLIVSPGNVLAAAYRNETNGSLQHVRRESTGWTAPVTVDPGPQRGGSCDIAYRPGTGYCFSERDAGQGAAMIAHPSIHPRIWSFYRADPRLDAGLQASMCVGPLGRLECAYLARDLTGKLEMRAMEIIPDSAFTSRFVADSVAMTPNAHIRPDVFVMPGEDWYISYRKAGPDDLYMASTDNWQLMPSDAPDLDDPASSGAPTLTFLRKSYPNPTRSGVRIHFSSAKETGGIFEIYSPDGRLVRRVDLRCRKGENTFSYDGKSATGSMLSSGVYFLTLKVCGQTLGPRKMVVIGGNDRME